MVFQDLEQSYDDNQNYKEQIRSLKATIAHLHNVIDNYKLREHRRAQINQFGSNQHQVPTENEEKGEPNPTSEKPSVLKSIFIESILDNLDSNRNEYPIEVINFCFCAYSICPHNYLLFREVLDLPSESTLKHYFSQKVNSVKENLTDLSKISMIIENYRKSYNIH